MLHTKFRFIWPSGFRGENSHGLCLSLNYSELIDHVDKLDSTDVEIAISTSYIELQIGMDSEDRLRMKL